MASLLGGEMIGRRVRRKVKVKEGVANIVVEGVMNWSPALVPNSALVERNG